MSTPITKKKHWLIELAETEELGSYCFGGIEENLNCQFIGALRGLAEGKVWGTPTFAQFQTLTRAHEEACRIIDTRRTRIAAAAGAAAIAVG